ncbi:MAG TPA: hypothetical protein VGH16_23550 [Candidatus Binatia bacterium]|jgi:hypothetical protein
MSDIFRRLKVRVLSRRQDLTYRRRNETQVWHFCANCSMWPAADFVETTASEYLLKGSLCLECIAHRHFGDCESSGGAKKVLT